MYYIKRFIPKEIEIFFDRYVNYINSPSMCPTEKVKSLKLQSNRFSIISEIITKLLHSDITYCEVPAFFHASSRKRKTVTLKNLYDTIVFCSTFC